MYAHCVENPTKKLPPQRPASKTEIVTFRITPEDRVEILRRAAERNMDLTTFCTLAALDQLDSSFQGSEELWREQVDRRLARLETVAYEVG